MRGNPNVLNALDAAHHHQADLQLAEIAPLVYKPRIVRTLTQAVNALTFDQGDDGLPLNTRHGKLLIHIPAGSGVEVGTTGFVLMTVNDIATGYMTDTADSSLYTQLIPFRTNGGIAFCELEAFGGTNVIFGCNYLYTDGTTRSMGRRVHALFGAIQSITKISMTMQSTYVFPVGTKIVYEEVPDA